MQKFLPDAALQKRVLECEGSSPERNARIFKKWFARGPRGRMQTLMKRYHLSEKSVADVGCGYGNNLVYFGPGSYGIEILEKQASFARGIGLPAYTRDFLKDDMSDLPQVDAAVCYAVIEHVESPHIAFRRICGLLKPGGIALIYVPTLPLIPLLSKLPKVGKHFTGYLHADHINAFTPATLRFMATRAGFEEIETTTALPGIGRIFDIPPFNRLIDGAVFVGRKIENWEYPAESSRKTAENGNGFVFK